MTFRRQRANPYRPNTNYRITNSADQPLTVIWIAMHRLLRKTVDSADEGREAVALAIGPPSVHTPVYKTRCRAAGEMGVT